MPVIPTLGRLRQEDPSLRTASATEYDPVFKKKKETKT
jgi:hypothetical protein